MLGQVTATTMELCPMGVCCPGVRAAAQRVPPAWSRVASGPGAWWLPTLRCACPPGVPRALNVTLVLQCERWRFVRVGLAVPLLGTVAELREMVAREGHIPPEQVTGGTGGDTAPGGHWQCCPSVLGTWEGTSLEGH